MSLADLQARASLLRTAVDEADGRVAAASAALAAAKAGRSATSGVAAAGSAMEIANLQAERARGVTERAVASANLHDFLTGELAPAGMAPAVPAAAAGPTGGPAAGGLLGQNLNPEAGLVGEPLGGPHMGPFVGPGHGPVIGPDVGPVVLPHGGPDIGPVVGPGHGPVIGPDVGPVVEPGHGPVIGPSVQLPERLLGELDTGVPITLLPVRLETRFGTSGQGPELRIRIFPDDIHVDSHESELTADEVAAGKRYWVAVWRGGTGGDTAARAAWAELGRRTGITRAAWIVRTMEPAHAGRPTDAVPDGTPLSVEPSFPDPAVRGESWSRPAWTTMLPEYWVATAYVRNMPIARAWSRAVIPDRLSLGPDPTTAAPTTSSTSTTTSTSSGQPPVDPGLGWLVDFAAAEATGMALRLPLPVGIGTIDRLVILGVKSSMDPAAGATRLAGLLDAHHYTDGLSFVPPATPTNNTPTDKAGWGSRPAPESAFDIEIGGPTPDAESNAGVTAGAFGVDPAILRHTAHATDDDQRHARSMNTVLWAPTWGYYLAEMMDPGFARNPAVIDAARDHFVASVRGIGPLPAIRVGNQPYGLLPVTSLDRWRPAGEPDAAVQLQSQLIRLLQMLRPYWQQGTAHLPQVGPGMPDPDKQIVEALGMSAVSSGLRVRSVKGATYCMAENGFLAIGDPVDPDSREWQGYLSTVVLLALQWPFRPYLADCRYEPDAATLWLPPVSGKADAAARTAEAAAYLKHLRDAPIHDVQVEAGASAGPSTLLNILARHATLQEYGVQAITLPPAGSTTLGPIRALEGELVGMVAAQSVAVAPAGLAAAAPAGPQLGEADSPILATGGDFASARITIPQQTSASAILNAPIEGVTGALTAGDYIARQIAVDPLPFRRLAEFLAALEDLAGVDADNLALVLAATLDTASHRFDAWASSIATARLATMRSRRATGTYIGAYGWVEGLKAKPALQPVTTNQQDETGPLFEDPTNAGFVHAPSLPQAATAAVMRSANLTHAARGGTDALAVDLSSGRVRTATRLLDGVRQGQPLGALLGYQFERALHEGHPGVELDACIAPLRALCPLVAGKLTPTADGESVEAVGARNVVDGLALSRLPRSTVEQALAAALPALGFATIWTIVSGELDALDDAIDAISDVLLSESVYQLVSGNPLRAGLSLDSISRGDHAPPEPEVIRTPRSGIALTERLLLLMPAAMLPAPGWPSPTTPRPAAEPRLDAWCGRMLGPAATYRLRVAYGAPAGSAIEVSLADLHLSALDIVMDCDRPGASALERRIVRLLLQSPPAGAPAGVTPETPVTLLADRGPTWTADVKGLPELLELGRTFRDLLTSSRPVDARDVSPVGPTVPSGWDAAGDLKLRSDAAVAALTAATTALQALNDGGTATDAQLDAAAWRLTEFGLESPPVSLGHDGLVAYAVGVAREAASRLKKATDLLAAGRPDPDGGGFDLKVLGAVFGPDFRIAPVCRPAGAADLQASFAVDLVAGDPGAATTWLERAAPIRPGAGRLHLALLYAKAMGTGDGLGLAVGQVPYAAPAPGDPVPRWVGLPFVGTPPAGPTTGLVALAPAGFDITGGLAGLVLDDWVEVVPTAGATTGLTFHFDAPGSRAPQAILLAVSPDPSKPWDLATLDAVLAETIDLTKMRLVDLEALPWAGRFLPATLVADNALDETPGIHLREFVSSAAAIHATTVKATLDGGG
jgi:hypothetical protein